MSDDQLAPCSADDVHCALCGDEALEGAVHSVDEKRRVALVIIGAHEREVAIDLLASVAPGDRVMVHQGFAIARVPA